MPEARGASAIDPKGKQLGESDGLGQSSSGCVGNQELLRCCSVRSLREMLVSCADWAALRHVAEGLSRFGLASCVQLSFLSPAGRRSPAVIFNLGCEPQEREKYLLGLRSLRLRECLTRRGCVTL